MCLCVFDPNSSDISITSAIHGSHNVHLPTMWFTTGNILLHTGLYSPSITNLLMIDKTLVGLSSTATGSTPFHNMKNYLSILAILPSVALSLEMHSLFFIPFIFITWKSFDYSVIISILQSLHCHFIVHTFVLSRVHGIVAFCMDWLCIMFLCALNHFSITS